MKRSRAFWIPALLFIVLTVPGLNQGDFRRDTARYAAVGLQQWETGMWWRPHLHPETPYFRKPPLATAIHGGFLYLFGISLPAARIPSILAGLGVVALTMAWVRRRATRSEAMAAGMVLAATYEYFRRTHEISLDLWQLFFVMASVNAFDVGRGRKPWQWMTLSGLAGGLALLCKPLLAFAVLPVYAVWSARSPKTLRWIPWIGLWMILTAAPWYGLMIHTYGDAFLNVHLGHEVVARAKGEIDQFGPAYYLIENAWSYWPWMLALMGGLWHWSARGTGRTQTRRLLMDAGWWVALVTLGLSLFPDKAPNYYLPVYPFLAVIAGYGLCRLKTISVWLERGAPWMPAALTGLLILLLVLPVRWHAPPDPHWKALFDWLEKREVNVAEAVWVDAHMESNRWARFYLRFRQWPRSVHAHRADLNTADAPSLLVAADGREAPGDPVFRSGPLSVTALRP